MTQPDPKDHWTHEAYSASASFVPQLTSKVLEWLNPSSSDIILDLGCGDGVLTAQLASRSASVTGYDASPNLIHAARASYGSTPNLTFDVQDCRHLESSAALRPGRYTKIFSNAALHWILRDPATRGSVLRAAHAALRPGGVFVFEMGGRGNVAEVHGALLSALVHRGVPIAAARAASPWFFPSETHMSSLLRRAGFVVEKSAIEYRPTRLTPALDGGLRGWVGLMGSRFLDQLGEGEREDAVGEVCEVLESVVSEPGGLDAVEGVEGVGGEGGKWLGYVRLRMCARKM